MPLSENELHHITRVTLDDYEKTAESFWHGTRNHDVSQNIDALLRHINAAAPFTLLDFGCGPGRDLRRLRELGHTPTGLDGTPSFVAMARAYSGCEVWQQDFLQLDLPDSFFDGIYANATLFHVPMQELPRVLRQLHAALKPDGVLFSSNPRNADGSGTQEGWNRERFGTYHDLASWRSYLAAAGFVELEHYYRPPGLPREQQPWLASVWRKI